MGDCTFTTKQQGTLFQSFHLLATEKKSTVATHISFGIVSKTLAQDMMPDLRRVKVTFMARVEDVGWSISDIRSSYNFPYLSIA